VLEVVSAEREDEKNPDLARALADVAAILQKAEAGR
jgi:hypothetical protein